MPASAGRPDDVIELPAPAKLNLFLHIVGRRTDGYHELQTVFQFVNLEDRGNSLKPVRAHGPPM